jgi:hypothetical protein
LITGGIVDAGILEADPQKLAAIVGNADTAAIDMASGCPSSSTG